MTIFWVVVLHSLKEVYWHFRGACCLHHHIIALMMDAASTSETLLNFHQATWRNNPEDSHLQICYHENLKSHLFCDHEWTNEWMNEWRILLSYHDLFHTLRHKALAKRTKRFCSVSRWDEETFYIILKDQEYYHPSMNCLVDSLQTAKSPSCRQRHNFALKSTYCNC
jgi:hypothetical protein